jgi:CheY-like chemotaxis protein
MDTPRTSSGMSERAVDVIVVEDDDDARTMMTTLLATNGCLVRAFDRADAALEAALARVPDVVVSDLRLRDGPAGWTLARALREDARTRHVSLIAVTGAVEPEREVVAAFDAYVRKPVDTSLVITLVQQLARISRAERRAHKAG